MLAKKLKFSVLLAAAALIALPVTGMSQGSKGSEKGTTTVPVGGGKGKVTAETLVTRYSPMAGSAANAKSLVNGLPVGAEVTLTGTIQEQVQVPVQTQITEQVRVPVKVLAPPPALPGTFTTVYRLQSVTRTVTTYKTETITKPVTITFTPPTGNMGLGNADIALAFTEAQLTEVGIGSSNPPQLHAALMGGSVQSSTGNTVQLPGILKLRASGKGWGQIAGELGYKLQ